MLEKRIPRNNQYAFGAVSDLSRLRVIRRLPSLFIHTMVVGTVILIWYCFTPATTLFWGGIFVAAGFLSIAVIEARYSPILISPLSFYFLWYSTKYGFASIYMSSALAEKGYLLIGAKAVSSHDVATGYAITLVGSLAFHFGLQMLRPTKSKRNASDGTGGFSVALESIILLWAVGLIAIYRPGPFKFLGLCVSIVALGPLAALITLALLPARALRLSPVSYCWLLVLGTIGLVVVSLGAQYSSKATVMLSVTPLLVAALVRPRLRKYIPAAGALLALIYLLGVAPTVNGSRTMPGRAAMSPLKRFVVGFEQYSPLYTGDFQSGFLRKQEYSFFDRMFEPTAVGFTAELVKRSGLMYGSTMSNLVYGFVPRILWPGKPKVNRGSFFTERVGMRGSATSTAMFPAGELYWNFGLLGVLAGMLMLGLGLSGLWRMAGVDPRGQLLDMWLYVWLVYGLFEVAEASSYLIGLVYTFLFFAVLLFFHTTALQVSCRDSLVRKVSTLGAARQFTLMDYGGRD